MCDKSSCDLKRCPRMFLERPCEMAEEDFKDRRGLEQDASFRGDAKRLDSKREMSSVADDAKPQEAKMFLHHI